MSLTTRVLMALVLGLAAGLVVLAHPTPPLLKLVSIVEPIGSLWVNAIRMTVVPLVVSLLITSVVSSSNMRVVRGIGLRALASFFGCSCLLPLRDSSLFRRSLTGFVWPRRRCDATRQHDRRSGLIRLSRGGPPSKTWRSPWRTAQRQAAASLARLDPDGKWNDSPNVA
jgi:hypothetical protein